MAPLAVSKPGKLLRSQAAQMMSERAKRPSASVETIFVKNQISFCTVVSLNLLLPDIATMRPMTDLSPIANTTPVQLP